MHPVQRLLRQAKGIDASVHSLFYTSSGANNCSLEQGAPCQCELVRVCSSQGARSAWSVLFVCPECARSAVIVFGQHPRSWLVLLRSLLVERAGRAASSNGYHGSGEHACVKKPGRVDNTRIESDLVTKALQKMKAGSTSSMIAKVTVLRQIAKSIEALGNRFVLDSVPPHHTFVNETMAPKFFQHVAG